MRKNMTCDVCGTACCGIVGPDGVRYCTACYQTAFGTSSQEKGRNIARQNRIRDLTMQKLQNSSR